MTPSGEIPFRLIYIGMTRLVRMDAACRSDGSVRLLKIKTKIQNDSFHNGIPVSEEKAARALNQLLEDDPTEILAPLFVCLSGAYQNIYRVQSSLYFASEKIFDKDHQEKVIQQTQAVASIPLDETILLSSPGSYLIDDLPDIVNPDGLSGRRIGVALDLYTLRTEMLKKIESVFHHLEIEPEKYIPRGYSTAEYVLSSDDKEKGVLLMDVGARQTQFFFYQGGVLKETFQSPWGGEYITESLSQRFHISENEARQSKEEHGIISEWEGFGGDLVSLVDREGFVGLKIGKIDFSQAMQEALKDGIDAYCLELERLRIEKKPVSKIVMTGSSVLMTGFVEMVQKMTGVACATGQVSTVSGLHEIAPNPSNAGLLAAAKKAASLLTSDSSSHSQDVWRKSWSKMARWMAEYL